MNSQSGKLLEASISEVALTDYGTIRKDTRFSFDWETEKIYEVYKVFLLSNDHSILGLMSLMDIEAP